MAHRIYVGTKPLMRDALGEKIRRRIISDLNIGTVLSLRTASVYTLSKSLSHRDLELIASEPLCDPVTQHYAIDRSLEYPFDWLVEVGYLPGVTDNAGRTATEAVRVVLSHDPGKDFSVHTGVQYFFEGKISRASIEKIANSLLANTLIQSVEIYTPQTWAQRTQSAFSAPLVQADDSVQNFQYIQLPDAKEELLKISRDGMLALTLEEMLAIKNYYSQKEVVSHRQALGLQPHPSDLELEILAQTWSEHCKHKIFSAKIFYKDEQTGEQETIDSLYASYIKDTTAHIRKRMGQKDICLSVFKDNAGVITFLEDQALVFKVETHNSPSALDPYGGALTGIVGVNRDPLGTGMGAKLVANTNVFCFASPFFQGKVPPRILHPKRVFEGVREGVEHGGNKSGIPTVNGSLVFDDRFL